VDIHARIAHVGPALGLELKKKGASSFTDWVASSESEQKEFKMALFSWRKILFLATATFSFVFSNYWSNYNLIRFKRFASQITSKLCN
jgi:hypothetical protein